MMRIDNGHRSLHTTTMCEWNTPEIIAFRAAARACFLAGESYSELKDILATEDELTKPLRTSHPKLTSEKLRQELERLRSTL
jgi:hypothetical protein